MSTACRWDSVLTEKQRAWDVIGRVRHTGRVLSHVRNLGSSCMSSCQGQIDSVSFQRSRPLPSNLRLKSSELDIIRHVSPSGTCFWRWRKSVRSGPALFNDRDSIANASPGRASLCTAAYHHHTEPLDELTGADPRRDVCVYTQPSPTLVSTIQGRTTRSSGGRCERRRDKKQK